MCRSFFQVSRKTSKVPTTSSTSGQRPLWRKDVCIFQYGIHKLSFNFDCNFNYNICVRMGYATLSLYMLIQHDTYFINSPYVLKKFVFDPKNEEMNKCVLEFR